MNPALLGAIRNIERNDENPYFEIVNGQIVMQQQKTVRSSVLASRLAFHLASEGKADESGYVVIRALFHLARNPDLMRRPELAFVSTERWPRLRCFSHEAIEWDVIPNLAIDIINPEDRADEVVQRINEYFAAGVELAWVIYPWQQLAWAFDSPTNVRVLEEYDILAGGNLLPQFRLPLNDFFID